MSEHSGSWQEGFDDGYAWCRDAKQMGPLEKGAGFGASVCPEKERERLMCSVGGKPTEAKVRTS